MPGLCASNSQLLDFPISVARKRTDPVPPRERIRRSGDVYSTVVGGLPNNPVGDLIDPSQLPGGGLGPDREPPHHPRELSDAEWPRIDREQRAYDEANRRSDISHNSSAWDAATERKVQHWGYRGGTGNPLIGRTDSNKDGSGKDENVKDSGGKDSKPTHDDAVKEIMWSKPGDKDPKPEGGDPDELMSPVGQEAAMFDRATAGFMQQYASGLPHRPTTVGEQGLEPWRKRSLAGPHVPRPDENRSAATLVASAQNATLSGSNACPPPDNPDGRTDPRASDGQMRVAGRMSLTASPADVGHDTDPHKPPRPEV